jgi:hypothetical protein
MEQALRRRVAGGQRCDRQGGQAEQGDVTHGGFLG